MIKLSDVCVFINGDRGKNYPSKADMVNVGVPFINAGHLENNTISFSNMNYITEQKYEKLSSGKICSGDLLYCLRGSLGKKAIVDEGIRGAIASSLVILRPDKSKIITEYLSYALESEKIQKQMISANNGSSQPNLSAESVKNYIIDLPDLSEQKHIVEELMRIDNLIQLCQNQISKLDELVKSRFVELFGDYDLSHVQDDWKPIFEIGQVVGGATPKTNVDELWDGEYRWITPAELQADSGYIYDSVRKLTKAGVESCSLQEMPIGTVILSSRAPIGKVAIAGNTFYCNQGFKNIICNKEILPRYLYTVLLLNTDYLNSLGRGATFKEISKSIVENIKVPVPSIDIQNEFAEFVKEVDKSKFEVQQSLEKLETLKKSLMQQYFG